MEKELSYWLALAHMSKLKTRRKKEIIVRLFEQGRTIVDFFHADPISWGIEFNLTESEVNLFMDASGELSNYAFMVEDLLEQGYYILPITSKDYSPALKKNLGRTYAPPVIYVKGSLQILKEKSIAIIGSRKANDISLKFTDNVAKKASEDHKVVVSGFAKGVDKQALDSALKYKGQSIIVLPQGIATFKSGFKKYYKQIIEGDVLVLSTFYPKAPWSVSLAMARNPIIYGLASEIYVAESGEQGGTWSGVIDGLGKGRSIFVRKPKPKEKNANGILISKGGISVNQEGNITSYEASPEKRPIVPEPEANTIEDRILSLLKHGAFDSKTIVDKLKIEWSAKKVTSVLKKNSNVKTLKGKPIKFTHKSRSKENQTTLF
jgi:predicted Rossmann fold nucleotide-binding protein DprA/Smf involved in DNA uptake